MTLEIAFELEEQDLEHFRKIMQEARDSVQNMSPEEIVGASRAMIDGLHGGEHPRFVETRLQEMDAILQMTEDDDWQLPDESNTRILNALVYFCEPQDLIPDNIPGIGLLDDAIMMELVIRELKPELEAYHDFCSFRDREDTRRQQEGDEQPVTRAQWLDEKRNELHNLAKSRHNDREKRGFFSIFPFT